MRYKNNPSAQFLFHCFCHFSLHFHVTSQLASVLVVNQWVSCFSTRSTQVVHGQIKTTFQDLKRLRNYFWGNKISLSSCGGDVAEVPGSWKKCWLQKQHLCCVRVTTLFPSCSSSVYPTSDEKAPMMVKRFPTPPCQPAVNRTKSLQLVWICAYTLHCLHLCTTYLYPIIMPAST